jgi:hypothetical protein
VAVLCDRLTIVPASGGYGLSAEAQLHRYASIRNIQGGYPFNWQPWIKQRELETAGEQADALRADTGATGAGNLVISWDSEQRVVFYGSRPHDGMSASTYIIVAPTTREMDIIWQRGDGITYLGPDAAMLKSSHAYEWLKQIGS